MIEEARIQGSGEPGETDLSSDEQARLKAVWSIFTRLSIACKSRSLYDGSHPAAREAVDNFFHVLSDSLLLEPSIAVQVGKENLLFEGNPVGHKSENLRQLSSRIRSLNIQEIVFSAGPIKQEAEALVELLVSDPLDVDAMGGAETFLLLKGVQGIRVLESAAQRAGEEQAGASPGAAAEAAEEREEPEPSFPYRAGYFLELARSPEQLSRAMEQLPGSEDLSLSKQALAGEVFGFLKEMHAFAKEKCPDRLREICRSMAEALLFLDHELRNLLFLEHLFPKIAEEQVCLAVMQRFNMQEMADVLASFFAANRELLADARNLLAALGYRGHRLERAVALLKARLIYLAELPLSAISALNAESRGDLADHRLPTLDEVYSSLGSYQEEELEKIRRISEFDLARETLIEGTPMLLNLLRRGEGIDNLEPVIELLQQNFWDLLSLGQLGLAAEILEGARIFLFNESRALERFRPGLTRLLEEAGSGRVVEHAIHLTYQRRKETAAVEGFLEYISALGERGVKAMVEALGNEHDMAVRKFIINLLKESGRNHIRILGAYVNDPRWYLVRNIVTILAGIRDPETLPYLRVAFHHPNSKVRAETVRALGMIGGYEAGELLMQGLRSQDEKVRMLCIRWIGRLEEPRAAGQLVKMLEGKEPGAESMQAKKEILSCLAKIGVPETYPVIRRYCELQRRKNRAEWREVNEVARHALDQLLEKYPHLGSKK